MVAGFRAAQSPCSPGVLSLKRSGSHRQLRRFLQHFCDQRGQVTRHCLQQVVSDEARIRSRTILLAMRLCYAKRPYTLGYCASLSKRAFDVARWQFSQLGTARACAKDPHILAAFELFQSDGKQLCRWNVLSVRGEAGWGGVAKIPQKRAARQGC